MLLSGSDSVPSSPASPQTPTTESPVTPITAAAAVIRRRSGRPRPRPISDYAQLVSRKFSIPEEEGAEPKPQAAAAASVATTTVTTVPSHESGSAALANGDGPKGCHGSSPKDHQWMRPMSVIGGIDMFPSAGSEEREDLDSLPSVSALPKCIMGDGSGGLPRLSIGDRGVNPGFRK